MGIFNFLKNKDETVRVSGYKMVTERGEGFYSYNGNLYASDIVRSCIRPKTQAIGKAVAKHIRKDNINTQVNPEPYIRFLLEEPNPYMSGQMLQEKMANQLALNNNAFALIERDLNGLATAIYPVNSNSVEALQNNQGEIFLKFLIKGKYYTFKYSDVIHIRRDFNNNDIFGESPAKALTQLMEIVNTTDQGIVKAIKNSNIITWLLKFNTVLREEDLKRQTKEFVNSFLSIESETTGAAATDAKVDAQQVEPNSYVPNSAQTKGTVDRIYSFFNTNENIIQSSYNEDQWISYYEAEIEPVLVQMSNEFTRKIFTRRERGFGNKIIFESSNLNFASMQTKLNLVQFVDRGIMNPDEVREILNMAPIPDGLGQAYIRRLDTREIEQGGEENDNKN
ncbi:phage portal protein [Peptoniphilus sp. BV3C26]|uniref:phage portal protein n=1 Tax=Peptoniphilus sp. BV3C26 TaxID=1111134 RepID=UPI0003B849BA|nr:phage portal protein [Peptoniphilus sp. BV3C26]ERT57745.1 phage portal protein [Peptoniphilus sp. BV3C26]